MFEFLEPHVEPVREVYLSPGDFCFGDGRLRITTLLGSCVSIILWHPLLKHGGMCHYMLPSRGGHQGEHQDPLHAKLDGKFGDEAVAMFLRELHRRHTVPQEYQVRIYGGGNMFGTPETCMDVGRRNVEIGHKLLDQHGFTVVFGHVGDFGHRKVEFDVWSGEVRLMHVSGAQGTVKHG